MPVLVNGTAVLPAVPFARALVPVAGPGRTALAAAHPDQHRYLDAAALDELAVRLLAELARAASPLLLARFRARPDRRPFFPGARAAYDRFEAELRGGGLLEIIESDPGRAEALALLADRWVGATGRLLDALRADAAVLRESFGIGLPVCSARRRDDTATRLASGDGRAVVFKDRSVATEVAFAELIAWFNSLGPSLDLRAPRAVDRGGYGWVDFVEHRAPEPSERARYLRRTGMVLALAHVLGGGDLHDANLLASGEHPMVVDAEKLLRPSWCPALGEPSVLDTVVLPTPGGYVRCGLANEVHVERPRRWVHVGTDAVRQRPIGSWLTDVDESVRRHLTRDRLRTVAELSAGFEEAYRLLQHHRLPLELLAGVRVRVLVRASLVYDQLIEACLEPGRAASESRRALVEALVATPPRLIDPFHPTAPLVAEAERLALHDLSVPRFWCRVGSRSIGYAHEELGPLFAASPLERAGEFVRSLSEEHLGAQLDAIAQSFAFIDSEASALELFTFTRVDLETMLG